MNISNGFFIYKNLYPVLIHSIKTWTPVLPLCSIFLKERNIAEGKGKQTKKQSGLLIQ